ncbi:hypothetical protein L2E82_25154 [Cichorium intybus]|uniref:Uncharacterized protein n=1 Tax=Cichorium intybus TaxID=13427 RepID=A0ACB9E2I4_CICIN|nr:hypothetical protein L2E82_25154 [Cichorium intybus]
MKGRFRGVQPPWKCRFCHAIDLHTKTTLMNSHRLKNSVYKYKERTSVTPALILSLPFSFCFFLQPSLYLSHTLIDTYRSLIYV